MNPFELINNSTQDDTNNIFTDKIEIWTEDRGSKCDTYIYGWNISVDTLKAHLKNIKKKNGCNGSIKDIDKDTGKHKILHLQGNHKDYIVSYLKEQGIDPDNIKIKLK